jgi:hypothetical protein
MVYLLWPASDGDLPTIPLDYFRRFTCTPHGFDGADSGDFLARYFSQQLFLIEFQENLSPGLQPGSRIRCGDPLAVYLVIEVWYSSKGTHRYALGLASLLPWLKNIGLSKLDYIVSNINSEKNLRKQEEETKLRLETIKKNIQAQAQSQIPYMGKKPDTGSGQ